MVRRRNKAGSRLFEHPTSFFKVSFYTWSSTVPSFQKQISVLISHRYGTNLSGKSSIELNFTVCGDYVQGKISKKKKKVKEKN